MTNENMEQWRLVNGYNNYEVSSVGRVRNTSTLNILKQRIDRTGYYKINLYKDNRTKTYQVHRLVAFAFCNNDNVIDYNVVDHVDRNKINNHFLNLRWATQSMNSRNATISRANTSGTKGVNFMQCSNSWRAEWTDNEGNKRSKVFSIKKYGDQAKQLAINKRLEMESLYGYL